ncbi:uncharacterized protein LOC109529051 isoform X2 [Hippocampus comes]|uniref:uncharacterized protein LOC109529051 isoform X2 n=1 Tax=Hippocampus comes TaxID=109280 RepID=UPI00094E5894|nr:PREDICTED: uncharacterized protein LOC109529051 isoform X2 [Hippocampus comes]
MNETRDRKSTQRSKIVSCLILNGKEAHGGKSRSRKTSCGSVQHCSFTGKTFHGSLFNFSIDSSHEDGSLGRLVNDAHKGPNCRMKKLTIQDKPHLYLFAIENIQAGNEITFDYGDSQWAWRALTPGVGILTKPSGDQEGSERSTSSLQQTPSDGILTEPSGDQEGSERSTSSLQQASKIIGLVPFHQTATAEQSRASRRLQNQARKEIIERERQITLSPMKRMTDSMSPDEYSNYDDMDYVPDTSGNSSDERICSTEHRITDSLVSPKEDMPVKDAAQIEEITTSAIASSHSISVTSCNATSSGNASESNSAIKVTPLPKGAKQNKYNKKQWE